MSLYIYIYVCVCVCVCIVLDQLQLQHAGIDRLSQNIAACNKRWEVVGHVLELMTIHSNMNGSNENLVELLKFSQRLHSRGTVF